MTRSPSSRNPAGRHPDIRIIAAMMILGFSQALAEANDSSPMFEGVHALLVSKCISCHGPEKQEGNLRLDSREAALQGGDQGPAVVPKDPGRSLLVKAILFDNAELQMPPKQKLQPKEIDLLIAWIKSGAEWSKTSSAASSAGKPIGDAFTDSRNPVRTIFRGERLDLWSLRKPAPPAEPSPASKYQTIDDFIRHSLTEAGLTLSPEADRRTLIRRLYFDLTGLPPKPEDVAAFLADTSDQAYNKVVESLLNSRHYGERQARLWLDVVRYADTHGYERDEFRPLAWQYRDYIVRSFNRDKPFDQLIREQLAGDELVDGPPTTDEEVDALIATGYLRLGQWDSTAPIFQEEARLRSEIMADLTNTTASAFLGLTMSCCQCHDHKYDPLTQADHYRLRAFFSGVTNRDDLPISLAPEQAEIARHNAEIDKLAAPLKAEKGKLPKEDKAKHEELAKQIAEIEAKKRRPAMAMAATDNGSTAPVTQIFYQGDFLSPRDEVQPGFPSVFSPRPAAIQPPRDNTTGRRLALAHWIASADNPWTARVIVNRIWQQHFGVGIVATPNDFGYTGSPPSHPELLDWLAIRFVAKGWSIKQLHRDIVTSATYRQSSRQNDAGRKVDHANRLLWRQNVQRLDAETIRDSLLATSGLLNPYDSGKPVWPAVPEELLKAQPAILEAEKGGDMGRMQGWFTDPVEKTNVRSLYLIRKRCLPVPFLQVFDLPDSTVSCARRDTTVVAPQSLMLLNSNEGIRYAEALAGRLVTGQPPNLEDTAQRREVITRVFSLTLQRAPTADEERLAGEFIDRIRAESLMNTSADQTHFVLTCLCRAMLNLNEFSYLD